MITKLENSNDIVANQIYTVFQKSYKVEAQLINVLAFPPLSRSAKNIADSTTSFYGYFIDDTIVGVIEITISHGQLDIHSLTVDPNHFRKGIADKLIHFVLNSFNVSTGTVETAVVNKPAIKLYEKHGFVECKRWIPSHGIEKLEMLVKLTVS